MKRFGIFFIALLMMAACNSEQDNGKSISPKDIKNPHTLGGSTDSLYPIMRFDTKNHDFGKIKEGEVVSHKFTFTNTGKANLIIDNASSSCGCTIPEFPKQPIAPGEEGAIVVEFNSRGRSNRVKKNVTIKANTNPNITNLTIEAFVER